MEDYVNHLHINEEIYEELSNLCACLKRLVSEKQKAVAAAPAGMLHVVQGTKRKHPQFYIRRRPEEKTGKYIKKDQEALVYKLAQKEYDRRLLEAARNEIKEIDSFLRHSDPKRLEKIYEEQTSVRQNLIQAAALPDRAFSAAWQAADYVHMGFQEGAPEFYSEKEERMRSKSEIIIANLLKKHNIPYQYERPLQCSNGMILHPDFMVLNVRKRESLFWEHFGMMDDFEYAQKALAKVRLYEKEGYFPGKKLIITHETASMPISTKELEQVIKEYLL